MSFPLIPFILFPLLYSPVSNHSTVYLEALAASLNKLQIQHKLKRSPSITESSFSLYSVLSRPPDGSSGQAAQKWQLCVTSLWKRLWFTYNIYCMTIVSYFRNVRCSLRQGWLNSSTFILLVDRVNPVWRISGSAVCHIRPGHSQSELITGLQMTRVVGSMISTERTFLLNRHAESAVSQIPHRPSNCTDSVSNHRGIVGRRRTGENCEKSVPFDIIIRVLRCFFTNWKEFKIPVAKQISLFHSQPSRTNISTFLPLWNRRRRIAICQLSKISSSTPAAFAFVLSMPPMPLRQFATSLGHFPTCCTLTTQPLTLTALHINLHMNSVWMLARCTSYCKILLQVPTPIEHRICE
jgi:hypothetical protein